MKHIKTYSFTILIAVIGAIIIALTFALHRKSINDYKRNTPYFIIANEVDNNISQSHLWLEEWLSGDKNIDYEKDISTPLRVARYKLNELYNGSFKYKNTLVDITDERFKGFMRRNIVALDNFIKQTNRRKDLYIMYKDPDLTDNEREMLGNMAIGSEIEQQYDESYINLLYLLSETSTYFKDKIEADINQLEVYFHILMIVLVLLVVFVLIVEMRTSRNNRNIKTTGEQKLQQETERIRLLTEFIEQISEGNYDAQINMNTEADNLAGSLEKMRDKLKESAEAEKRRNREIKQQNWVTTGLSELSDIIHQSSSKLSELSNNILKNLIKYIDANQGGLFMLNEEDPNDVHMELIAAFAYDRKKFMQKRIAPGQGLVGACLVEKETIYLDEIPDDYVSITSGLGTATPNTLLLVPLKLDDRIFGVLEMASFKAFQTYEIRFVEQIAETIASTLSSAKINARTAELLEISRIQTEEKTMREEQLRRNMEEMQKIQEEREIKKIEMEGLIHAIDNITMRAEIDLKGRIIAANGNFLGQMGYNLEEIRHRNIREFLSDAEQKTFERIWAQICFGKKYKSVVERKSKDGDIYWHLVSYTPMEGANGSYEKVLMLANDITAQKEMELKANEIADEMRIKEMELYSKQNGMEQSSEKLQEAETILRNATEAKKAAEKDLRQKVKELAVQEEVMAMKLEYSTQEIAELKLQLSEYERKFAKE